MAPPAVRVSRRKHIRFLLIMVLVTASIAGWWVQADSEPSPNLLTVAVQRGDLQDLVTATGVLQPRDYVDVGAQVSGQLEVLHVQTGDDVKEGDLLAR